MKVPKLLKIFLPILVTLILLRVVLPYTLLYYVAYRANQIPGYHVTVADLDVHLYRGSYTVKDIRVDKTDDKIPVPFFAADKVELGVEWRALLHGSVATQTVLVNPTMNFIAESKGKNGQLSINEGWQKTMQALFPLNIDHIEVKNGTLHFRSYEGKPSFDVYLKNIDIRMDNLRNALNSKEKLPSIIALQANTMDGAPVKIDMRFNLFAKQPTFYLKVSVENMDIKKANDFLHHYTKVNVKQGWLSLYVEAAAADGKIKGYAEPMIKNLQIIEPKKDVSPVQSWYKGALQIAAKVSKNPDKKTIATRINITGNIENQTTNIGLIIGNLLYQAFLQALLPQIDHTVDRRDVEIQ